MNRRHDARGLGDGGSAASQVIGDGRVGQPHLPAMPIAVQRDTVPRGHDLGRERGPGAHLLAHEKEGRHSRFSRQYLENERGPHRMGAIVEGQRHASHPREPPGERERGRHSRHDRRGGGKDTTQHRRRSSIRAIALSLDSWLPDPAIRVEHRRQSRVPAEALWAAARTIELRDTQLLGRLVRWRIPGTPAALAFDEMVRRPPVLVLEEHEQALVSGLVGSIWTLRRDYPALGGPEAFRAWSQRGTARVIFATWAERLDRGSAALCSEVRVEAIGRQAQLGLATVRPLVRGFHQLIGSDGITAAVVRAERGHASA